MIAVRKISSHRENWKEFVKEAKLIYKILLRKLVKKIRRASASRYNFKFCSSLAEC